MVKNLIGRPLAVVVICTLIFGVSLYMSSRLKQALVPDIEIPMLMVSTTYTGAGPEEVEQSITKPLESALLNVSGVQTITSTSSEGSSTVSLEFAWGANLDQASLDVRDKLDRVRRSLPDDADTPTIIKFDMNSRPIITLSVTGDGRTSDEIKALAEDLIQPYLEQVEGVSSVDLTGGREQQVRVEAIQNRLESYGITLTELAAALAAQNVDVSGGNIEQGERRLLVRTAGRFSSIEQIRNTVVSYVTVENGTETIPVLLRDIADVFLGYEDESTISLINRQEALNIQISKSSDANTVDVARLVHARLPEIAQTLPNGIVITVLQDSSTQIENSINSVTEAAISGILLAVAVLVLFLRNIRSALIIAIVIPLSIFVTLMGMNFLGITLNLISLAGLTLGVGMIVDSSIVIIENITKYREKGTALTTAAVLGSREMIGAIVASTLTTISVFIPMIMLNSDLGMTGMFIRDLSFTIVMALVSSLFFSVTLTPVLASSYLPVYTAAQRQPRGFMGRLDRIMAKALTRLDISYKNAIKITLKHKAAVILTIFLVLIAALFLFRSFVGVEGLPRMQSDTIYLNYELPVGTTLAKTRAVGEDLVDLLLRDAGPAIDNIILNVGRGGRRTTATYKGTLQVTLPPYKERTMDSMAVQRLFRSYYPLFPGVSFGFTQSGTGGSANAVSLLLKGTDYEALTAISNEIVDLLNSRPELTDAESDLDSGLPQIEVEVDRSKAYSLGLSVASIGNEIAANVNGITAGVYSLAGDDIDIRAVLRKEDRSALPDLDRIFMKGTGGVNIALASVAELVMGTSPVTINRENQARTLTITAAAARGVAPNAASELAARLVKEQVILPEGITVVSDSDYDDVLKMVPTLVAIIVMAVTMVYAIMAAQFESLKGPFVIISTLLTVPIGPVLIHILSGRNFSTLSAIGFVLLVGIVVNNGIILVDYTNLLRLRGRSLYDAIVEGAGSRLRPILMTSLTTILGMIPMAFFPGEGGAFTSPIGVTVLGGMISSTFMTLFLVPPLYAIIYRDDRKDRALASGRNSVKEKKSGRPSDNFNEEEF